MKIEINGNEYGLHWGMPALGEMCEMLDIPLETCTELMIGSGDHSPFKRAKASATAIFCAMRHYARLNRLSDPDVTIYDVENYCDITPVETFSKIRNDFTNSMINGRVVGDLLGLTPTVEKQVKKKSPSTKRSSSSTRSVTNPGK